MIALHEKIRKEGTVAEGNILRVDCFLNHQVDVLFMDEIGREFHRLFADSGVTKILTAAVSGIAIAAPTARFFGCPMLIAKKYATSNVSGDVISVKAHSYTSGKENYLSVSRSYINENDKILIIDDFLAEGSALTALVDIVKESGATLVGAGVVIEKAFQGGGDKIRERGVRIEALARIASMSVTEGVTFC